MAAAAADEIIAPEVKRRRLTPYDLQLIADKLHDPEQAALFEQLERLVPVSAEGKLMLIEEQQQQQILSPGDHFAQWEVWVTSGENAGGHAIVQQLNALGVRARVVSQSIMVIGDYWVVYRGALVVELNERKSIGDFLASIYSGHYHDQAIRMAAARTPFTYWIIVGTTAMIGNIEQRQAIHTAIASITHMYPAMKVEQISDEQLVAKTLQTHVHSIQAYFNECEFCDNLPSVNHLRQTCKVKQLDSQESVWLVWMCTPLRVGPNAARAAVNQYPSVSAYCQAVRSCATRKQAEGLLTNIKVPKIKGDGFLNFGQVASKRVLECTFTKDELNAMWP